MWLFSENKIMTRDNLRARGIVKPLECELCKEIESIKHLFFECLIYRQLWDIVAEVFDINVINFESIASKWLCNKKFLHFNVVSSAILWCIWNNRNSLVFNRTSWINMKQVWRLIMVYLKNWQKPFKDLEQGKTAQFLGLLVTRLKSPLPLPGS